MNIDREDEESSSCLWTGAGEANSFINSKTQTHAEGKMLMMLRYPGAFFAKTPETTLLHSCVPDSSWRRPEQWTAAYAEDIRTAATAAGASAAGEMLSQDSAAVLPLSPDAVSEAHGLGRRSSASAAAARCPTANSTAAREGTREAGLSASRASLLPTMAAASQERAATAREDALKVDLSQPTVSAAAALRERLRQTRRGRGLSSNSMSLSSSSSGISEDEASWRSSSEGSLAPSSGKECERKRSSTLISRRFSLLRRRFGNVSRVLTGSRRSQQQQHCKVDATEAQQQQACSLDQESSAVVVVSDCDRFYMCAVDSDQDTRTQQSSETAGTEPAATCTESAFFFYQTPVDGHAAALPEAAEIGYSFSRSSSSSYQASFQSSLHSRGEEQQQQHFQEKRPRREVCQGSSRDARSGDASTSARAGIEYCARRIVTEPQQASPPAAGSRSEGSLGGSVRRRRLANQTAARDHHSRADLPTADSAAAALAATDLAAAGSSAAAHSAAAGLSDADTKAAGFLTTDSAKSRLSIGGNAAAGSFSCRRRGNVCAAASAAAGLAAVSSYENSKRRWRFLLLLVAQLCLCGALLVTACVGFARVRDNTAEPADVTAASAASGFPKGEGFSAARGSETVLRWMLLISAAVASGAVLFKRFFFSRVWRRFRRRVVGTRGRLLSLFSRSMRAMGCCFRQGEAQKEQQEKTKKHLLLQEFPSPNTRGHSCHQRRSLLRHIPSYHLHPVYLRNRREEAAILACALLLAVCGAALLVPSVLVLETFCHFSERDWMQQSRLQEFPSFSFAEAEQARLHAARLCNDRGLVLCCLCLVCLLSLSELLLLWLHRRVAMAAAVAAGAAAAAALAATMAYANPAFDRRLSSTGGSAPRQRGPQQFLRVSLAAAVNSSNEQQLQQPHRGAVGYGAGQPEDSDREEAAKEKKTHNANQQKRLLQDDVSHEGREDSTKHILLLTDTKQKRQQDDSQWKEAACERDADSTIHEQKVRRLCACESCSLWDAVLLLGYGKFLSGCILLFAASILLHEQSCYRSTHAFLRKEALNAAGVNSHPSFETQHKLEGTLVMPYTAGQEVELLFGSAVTGMMLSAGVNIVCGIYGTLCGWRRSPLLSGLNVLLNAIVIWMEFATCVGLLFGAAGFKFFCNYSEYPVSQEPVPRFLASYICSGSHHPFLLGWAAGGAAFLIVFADFIVDSVLLCREIGSKAGWQVPGLTGGQSE